MSETNGKGKILLLGADGQVGRALRRSLLPLGQVQAYGRAAVDISDHWRLQQVLEQEQAAIIVNAAAYTAVDKAESEPEKAFAINAEAVAVLADYAAASGRWLVHYSTDYVFDGEKNSPYRETDPPKPLNVYGESKYAGEQAVQQAQAKHLIIRTAWVYSLFGQNFLKTILRLAQSRSELRVVADQHGTPTSADLIADVTAHLLAQVLKSPNAGDVSGIYHLTAGGATTWFDYAAFLLTEAAAQGFALTCSPDNIFAIETKDYPTAARRPRYSCLDTQKIQTTFGLSLPPWPELLKPLLQTLRGCPDFLR
jgi:dTDP-4-dehydrorhamnose reductase